MADTVARAVLAQIGAKLVADVNKAQKEKDVKITQMQKELRLIHALLIDADSKPNINEFETEWLNQVKEIADRINSVIDTFRVKIEENRPKSSNRVIEAVKRYYKTYKVSLSEEVEDIMQNLNRLYQRRTDLGIFKDNIGALDDVDDPQPSDKVDDPEVVGLVGTGGIGKITLATKLYKRREVKELRQLTEQQAPGSQAVGYFAEYSNSELRDATNNFHESLKLGEGGFGIVYKGILHNTTVAIKILKEGSKQGAKEFHQEIEILSKVRHPNLVTLIGACAESRAVIYEYLPNGSLEDRLRCKTNTSPLSWQARTRIAFEICSALSFLHCSKPHGIVHGDLKPGNILLDLNNVSKISDFGLCRELNWIASTSVPCHVTDCPKGTFAYMDPDIISTGGKITSQYDVYSFGIVLLRLVTCEEPRGIRYLVEEAQTKGTLKALIDASAGPWPFNEANKMITLGLRCSDRMRNNRPDLSTEVWKEMKSMAEVASVLVS